MYNGYEGINIDERINSINNIIADNIFIRLNRYAIRLENTNNFILRNIIYNSGIIYKVFNNKNKDNC